MKIIISRKGFDSSAGGCASPILPDGTMLSMPIPSDDGNVKYSELMYKNVSYSDILKNCNPKIEYDACHLDPDIRSGIRKDEPSNWQAAFGQVSNAQTYLKNAGVAPGDIFLFFGWFHSVDDSYQYINSDMDFYKHCNLHAIYGYMQVGSIISGDEIKNYKWHPHSKEGYSKNNTLYLPSQECSLTGGPGFGVLSYDNKRVLTQKDMTRANWIPHSFLMPEHLVKSSRKNRSKCGCLYYAGQWQELVFDAANNPELLTWVKDILTE